MLTRARNTLHDAVEFKSAKPAFPAGIRAAIATVVPLLLGTILGVPALTWAALGGFMTSLGDHGGAYQTRAIATGAVTMAAAISAVVGALAGATLPTAVVGMLVWATAATLCRVLGAAGTSAGVSAAIIFADSLATPLTSWYDAFVRGILVAIGGGWAMFLSLSLWPIHYYRPARRATGEVYRRLADTAESVARFVAGVTAERQQIFQAHPAHIRDALEVARETIAATRKRRTGESPRGERLLVALEAADQAFAIVMAVADTIDTLRPHQHVSTDPVITRTLQAYARTARDIAVLLETERDAPFFSVPHINVQWLGNIWRHAPGIFKRDDEGDNTHRFPDITWGSAELRGMLLNDADLAHLEESVRARYEHIVVLITRLRRYTEITAANAAALDTAHPIVDDTLSLPALARAQRPLGTGAEGQGSRQAMSRETPPPWWSLGWLPQFLTSIPSPFEILATAISRDSVVWRHALRVGFTSALGFFLASWWKIDHAYWVTLTVIVILQPYLSQTILKTLQRVGGTVLGCVVAALLAMAIPYPEALLVLVFILAAVGVSIMPINYGLYSMFIACTFVLLSELNAGDLHLYQSRIINTVIGGALALLSALLFWPQRERLLFPVQIAQAWRKSQLYVRAVLARALEVSAEHDQQYAEARAALGLAIINAEASFQRLLAEEGEASEHLETTMALVLYTRRFNTAVTGLGSAQWDSAPQQWRAALDEGEKIVEQVLHDLADAIEQHRAPPPFPHFPTIDTMDPAAQTDSALLVYRLQVERVVRQLRVLHSAVTRYINPTASMLVTTEISLPLRYKPL